MSRSCAPCYNTAVTRVRDVAVERIEDDVRNADNECVVVEAPLQLRARGVVVATIMRTPGHDLELVRGLLHAESIGRAPAGAVGHSPASASGHASMSGNGEVTTPAISQVAEDAVDIDIDASGFAARGLLATAACGVCGRVAIADLELRAREVTADTTLDHQVLAALPGRLRSMQEIFADTGGLHAAGLFTTGGELVAAREDVGRHNAVDKLVGWALEAGVEPDRHVLVLSGRAGYELVQKAVMFGVPIVASVSAPSSLAIELAERFRVALAGFVRGTRANLYAHAWRIR
jgi:FdhD protein